MSNFRTIGFILSMKKMYNTEYYK